MFPKRSLCVGGLVPSSAVFRDGVLEGCLDHEFSDITKGLIHPWDPWLCGILGMGETGGGGALLEEMGH